MASNLSLLFCRMGTVIPPSPLVVTNWQPPSHLPLKEAGRPSRHCLLMNPHRNWTMGSRGQPPGPSPPPDVLQGHSPACCRTGWAWRLSAVRGSWAEGLSHGDKAQCHPRSWGLHRHFRTSCSEEVWGAVLHDVVCGGSYRQACLLLLRGVQEEAAWLRGVVSVPLTRQIPFNHTWVWHMVSGPSPSSSPRTQVFSPTPGFLPHSSFRLLPGIPISDLQPAPPCGLGLGWYRPWQTVSHPICPLEAPGLPGALSHFTDSVLSSQIKMGKDGSSVVISRGEPG